MSVQSDKHSIVSRILSNPLWMPSSGLWCRMYNQLMKMSHDDLDSLLLIVAAKEQYAAENPAKWVDGCLECNSKGHKDYVTCESCHGTGKGY